MRPLVLTAELDREAFAHFDRLRQSHFPPERNLVPAHLTLFHHLAGHAETEMITVVADEIQHFAPIKARCTDLRLLGRGVAYTVEAPDLKLLRARLRDRFASSLTAQDQAPFRPHITVQNKATPEAARALAAHLTAAGIERVFTITGLLLWRYLGGPWEHRASIPFAGADRPFSAVSTR